MRRWWKLTRPSAVRQKQVTSQSLQAGQSTEADNLFYAAFGLSYFLFDGGQRSAGVSLVSVPDFSPPFYLEAAYTPSPSRKASGFRILGARIGNVEDREAKGHIVLAPAESKESGKQPAQDIAAVASLSPCRFLLKLFVDQDPAHAGRLRFQGQLTTQTGVHFFRLDDQPFASRKLEIMTESRNTPFEVARFQVWTHPENVQGLEAEAIPVSSSRPVLSSILAEATTCTVSPNEEYFRSVTQKRKTSARVLTLEGNGLAIADGDEEPDPMRHTDFGSAPVRGSLTRTFTLYNLGPKPLELGGPPPHVEITGDGTVAFSVTKAPQSAVGGYGATTFDLRFQPPAEGFYRAQVVLEYGKSGHRHRFQVQGQGG